MNTCQTCSHLLKDERCDPSIQFTCECPATPFTFVSDLDTPHYCAHHEDNGGLEEVIGIDGIRRGFETVEIDVTSEVDI